MSDKSLIEFSGWLPNGARIFYKITYEDLPEMVRVAGRVNDIIELTNIMLAQGMSIDPPGLSKLAADEHREKVNGVLRRNFMDDTGAIVPVVDIYPDNPALGRRCVFYYLDSEDQIAEFEDATGIKIANMPVFGETQLNRNDKPQLAQKFIVPVTGNVSVVFKDNPAYDPDAAKKKAKHLFVRWETATPQPPPPPAAAGNPTDGEPESAAGDWEAEERRKAQHALDNEAVTIEEWRYDATRGGQGVPRWKAKARVADGAMIYVSLYPEHMNALKKAGYPTPNDAGNLDISVTTVQSNGERRISAILTPDGKVIPVGRENTANGHFDADNPPKWIYDFTKVMYGLRDEKYPPKEKAGSVKALYEEGAFDNVASVEAAVELVKARLASHRNQEPMAEAS